MNGKSASTAATPAAEPDLYVGVPEASAAEHAAETGACQASGRALSPPVRRSGALQHRPRSLPGHSGGPDAALRVRAVASRRRHARHRRVGPDRPADDRRARDAARDAHPRHGRHAFGDPGDPEEERELDARPRRGDREFPAPAAARGRSRRRAVDRRQADRRLEPGHPPRRHDDLYGHPAPRE